MINVYRASAGAGKTHKLAGEYIKLLFKKPYAYKHILAVTFTNKATDEMKQRILQELYTLSLSNSKSDYLVELCDLYKKDEYWVRGEARRILVAILNDYSSFAISTIDKFFQTVMRAFARELGKIATYNVELDSDSVLSNSIDRMFSELDKPENNSLLKWLIA
ncbi:MAG: UvrD-helicase domain-containing protein, partial [Bacteroidales bacterium]